MTDENAETDSYDTSTSTSSPGIQEQNFVLQQQQGTFPAQAFQQDTPYLPPIGTYFPPLQNEYLQYQGAPSYGSTAGMQYSYATSPQQQYQGSSTEYSSRIEDVRRAPSQPQVGDGESEVRSQYIVARSDNVWRAAH